MNGTSLGASIIAVIGGVGFMVLWFAGAAVWALMTLMSGAMANDAERLPADRHTSLLLVMFAGEALVALAGAPAGLAFFWTGARAPLLWTIAGLLVTGLALQIWSWWSFFHAAS